MNTVPTAPAPGDVAGWFNLDNVRTLRVVAFCLDAVVVAVLYFTLVILTGAAAFPTFGASLLLWPLLQFTGLVYAGLTIGGRGQGTWGMRAVGLKATDIFGERVGFLQGAAHAAIFWLSAGWLTWLLLAVSFFNPYKRTLHDLLTGIVISRRRG